MCPFPLGGESWGEGAENPRKTDPLPTDADTGAPPTNAFGSAGVPPASNTRKDFVSRCHCTPSINDRMSRFSLR